VVNALRPKERDIAMVFQNYALYPHMTVYDNMAFSLRLAGVAKDEAEQRVAERPRSGIERLFAALSAPASADSASASPWAARS